MPFITVPDGTRVYYEESGEGEPLILISGQGLDHTFWDPIRDDFADNYRVIVYDQRGTGQSDKPSTPPYTTRMFAQDVIALLDHLNIERAHAYGISMGGRICQWLGIDHGDRIGSLVLSATTPGNAHGVRRPKYINDLLSQSNSQKTWLDMLSLLYSPEWLETHMDIVKKIFISSPIPEYARKLHYQASENHDAWDFLPDIHVPVLVIHGSEDEMNPTANAYLLADRIPNAELSIINGGRHGYFIEFREEVTKRVIDFLKRHPL
ncbi:alpha/beta hydrolase [Shimazuella sp. AN120528]|uniref:alpha/beta fold hydrolase n=1 Tax=Shimazuella soli TaxID=1892854 RepID=UPI001F10A879|nr:alpha/beta fold hydrolase [Shimazuella soli]MCH5583523.1 alpha/beta hydrolase [Shimazuella soli]